jgi:hypothetical protein
MAAWTDWRENIRHPKWRRFELRKYQCWRLKSYITNHCFSLTTC